MVSVGVIVGAGGAGVFVHVGTAEAVGVGVGMGLKVGVGVSVGSSNGGAVNTLEGVGDGTVTWRWTWGREVEVTDAVGGAVALSCGVTVLVGVRVELGEELTVRLATVGETAARGVGTCLLSQAPREFAARARSRKRARIRTPFPLPAWRSRNMYLGSLLTSRCYYGYTSVVYSVTVTFWSSRTLSSTSFQATTR
jgi:hypothetical protein